MIATILPSTQAFALSMKMSINNLFYPRGLVVIGSASKGKLGHELLRNISDGGFKNAFAVNPRAQGAFSIPGYPTVTEINHPVDLAIIVSPPHTLPEVLEDCGRANVGSAVIITAGYSEVGNHSDEQQLLEIAQEHGIRFVGPNCAGIINTSLNLYPTLETRPPPGGVALVSQSGALGGIFLAMAKEHELGVSKFVSYGNAADLTEVDFIKYFASDQETRVVVVYIESVTDGRGFMRAMVECSEQKPIVIIKAGRTRSGGRATLSHTGSMAGSDAVYDAVIRQCGALRAHTVEEAFDVCVGFISLPRIEGHRIAIVTNSGGPGVLAADRAEEVCLDVARPSLKLSDELSFFLPSHCALKNPFDLTVEGTEKGYCETLLAVLKEYDMAIVLNIAPPYLESVQLARGICDAADQTGKPTAISFMPGPWVDDGINYAKERGIPNFSSAERAVAALAAMANYYNRKLSTYPWMEAIPKERMNLVHQGCIVEPEAMSFLLENGFPVPDYRFSTTEEEALEGCRDLGYPVVMKVVARDILHKSDYKGVILNIENDNEVRSAYNSIMRIGEEREFQGVVIYPMITGAVEVLMGISRDPQFGPVVAFGLGGIYTEIFRDITLRVAPIDVTTAMEMVQEIDASPILQGARGGDACDLSALADTLVKLSRMPFRYPNVAEVDLNPVFSLPQGAVIGDVRVILGPIT